MSDLVDRFTALKDPERVEKIAEAMRAALARHGITGDADAREAERTLHQWKVDTLEEQDNGTLAMLGLTPEDAVKDQEARARRKRESGAGPGGRQAAARDTALRSFIVSEIEGHTYAAAVDSALGAIAVDDPSGGPSRRTVERWLDELQSWRATTIPRPTRQRSL